jgi:hypothetical protein
MKNVSEVEHDTIPYARSFPPVLSLRASLTLTANTFLLPVRAGVICVCTRWALAPPTQIRGTADETE